MSGDGMESRRRRCVWSGGAHNLFPLGATLKDEAEFLELSCATSTHLAVAAPHALCVNPARQTGVAGILHRYLPSTVHPPSMQCTRLRQRLLTLCEPSK